MISLSGVYKNFGRTTALYNASFQAKEGEIIGFLGVNGAGKTTTMRLILGLLQPTIGMISVNAKSPFYDRVNVVREIGYLAENNPLYPEMKVAEYLDFVKEVKSQPYSMDIIEETGLASVLNTKIEELSRGFKQRVGLAAALIGEPRILILDEPTSGLDPLEQEKIRTLIKKIAKKRTIIFSTHILSEAEAVATKIIIINKGKIVFNGKKPPGKGKVEKLFKKYVRAV